ncbi:MAG: hypothetical protein SFW08_14345 [Gemmatimonadaceae bacterium]|nr:hypothetical protein [Gemmatimonadaceae bacterium]
MSEPQPPRRSTVSRPATPAAGGPGLNWLPPEQSGPPLPRVRSQRRAAFRVPPWLAIVTLLAGLAAAWMGYRDLTVDDTATPDRIRIGSEVGAELARTEVLKFRRAHGRWPVSLGEIGMAGWGLTYKADDNQFEVFGSDGAGGQVRRSGTLEDVGPLDASATTSDGDPK